MNPDLRIYRIPLAVATALLATLVCWIAWAWDGYQDRSEELRRQRAGDTFEMLNAIIGTLGNGALTDWHQIEQVLDSIIQDSRTRFVIIQDRHGRLAQTGDIPDFPDLPGPVGEQMLGDTYLYWDALRPVSLPRTWDEFSDSNMTFADTAWPDPVMYLGLKSSSEEFRTSRFWQRQGPVFLAAAAGILTVMTIWIAGIRRRTLANLLTAERTRSAHLEELGLAAAGLAHETKNPLGIIMGMAQQIAARPGIPEDSRVMLEHIMDEVDKATSRLGNFMAFARQREAHLEPVALHRLCAELAEILGPDFEANGVQLVNEVPQVQIMADPTLLRQVLVNLLLNSLHASPTGTTVIIRTSVQHRRLQLMVQDQGHGIGPDLLPEIFKPYVSGSPTGHGLGLAIVKRLVEAQGWRIQAESIVSQGTSMIISGIRIMENNA